MSDTTIAAPGRRHFLNRLWTFFGLAAVAELGWLGVSFMGARKRRSSPVEPAPLVTAGPLARFEKGTVTAIPQGRFYLARLPDGGLLALSRTCTHLGCSIPWDAEKKRFVCPCHGSTFDLKGVVLGTPATRPLDLYPVRIENGIVKVDVSAPKQRERFEPEQAARI